MKKIIGNVNYDPSVDYSDVEEITGFLDLGDASDVSMPVLATVGGSLDLEDASNVSMPVLATVGGDLDLRGASDVSMPKNVKTGNGNQEAKRQVLEAFRHQGFLFADGILSEIVETKQLRGGAKIHKIVVVGKTKPSYCIESDGQYSHGDTIQEARESLLYKVGERDKSKYKGWKLGRKITKKDAIESYRVITGACEAGVRGFVERHGKLKVRYTVQEVIDITQGQYGNEVYAAFFGAVAER